MTLHHTLYRKLTVLIPTLPQVPECAKSQVSGFMDLNLDLLSRNGEIITVALSHYYEQNGDLIPDPDMVVRIDTKTETVEALTSQDTYTYREVYVDGNRVDLKAKKDVPAQRIEDDLAHRASGRRPPRTDLQCSRYVHTGVTPAHHIVA